MANERVPESERIKHFMVLKKVLEEKIPLCTPGVEVSQKEYNLMTDALKSTKKIEKIEIVFLALSWTAALSMVVETVVKLGADIPILNTIEPYALPTALVGAVGLALTDIEKKKQIRKTVEIVKQLNRMQDFQHFR